MLLDGIILTCALRINEERSVSNIYRLLTGNRSLQTLQDAYLYKLDGYYGVLKKLPKGYYQSVLEQLSKQQMMQINKNADKRKFLQVTEKGIKWLESNENLHVLSYLNGKDFHETGEVSYHRLLLLIQTLTNTKKGNTSFIPIIADKQVHQWVKMAYRSTRKQETLALTTLEAELSSLLEKCPERLANIFVDRLTAYNHYGKSLEQLALEYEQHPVDIQLLLTATIHFMITEVNGQQSDYPALSKIIANKPTSIELQHSTKQTYHLFKQGYSPEEMATTRQLKLNTIYDHLAEIALKDNHFPFQQFISHEEKQMILQVINEVQHFKLKDIKEKLTADISYFQIRLMLAWYQHQQNNSGHF